MAGYQGARRRATLPLGLEALPGVGRRGHASDEAAAATATTGRGRRSAGRGRASAAASTAARRTSRAAGAVKSRASSSIGFALAAIVIVFSAAFLSLSQSVRVAATGYDIVRLVSEQERLHAIGQELQSDVERLRSEPAIRKQALDHGLGQLGAPVVIPAR
jgi:hypothetical protein